MARAAGFDAVELGNLNDRGVVTPAMTDQFVSGRGARARSVLSLGSDLTTSTLGPEPFVGSYCRVTVVDMAGKRA